MSENIEHGPSLFCRNPSTPKMNPSCHDLYKQSANPYREGCEQTAWIAERPRTSSEHEQPFVALSCGVTLMRQKAAVVALLMSIGVADDIADSWSGEEAAKHMIDPYDQDDGDDDTVPADVNTQEWLKGAHVGILAVCAVLIRRSHGAGPQATHGFSIRARPVPFDQDLEEVRDRVLQQAREQERSDSFVKGVQDSIAVLWDIASLS